MNESPETQLLAVSHGTTGLGPVRTDLAEFYWRLDQDPAVLTGIGRQTHPSAAERTIHTETHVKGTLDSLLFTVYAIAENGETTTPIGLAGVDVDWRRRTGMFHIRLDSNGRDQGHGTEATRLVLDYAFHVAHLGCIHLAVYEPNERAARTYEKAGFRRIGVRRNSGYWVGERCNEILMDAVPEDFKGESVICQKIHARC